MRQTIDKIVTFILRFIPAVTAFLVPLFFLPNTPDFFFFNKQYLIYVIASVALVCWGTRLITRNKLHLTISPSSLPIAGLVAVFIISSLWLSPNHNTSLFGQTAVIASLAIIFFTVTSTQKNEQVINTTIASLISSATLLSIISIFQNFGLTSKFTGVTWLTSKYFTPAGGPLAFASFVLPITIATILLIVYTKKWLLKSVLFISIVFMIIGTAINVNFLLPQGTQPGLTLLPLSAGWSISLDTFKDWRTALFGTGPETFVNTFTRLRPAYLNYDKDLWNMRFTNSSNELFTLLTTTGLLGVILFFFTFARTIISLTNKKLKVTENPQIYFLLTAITCLAISFFLVPGNVILYATAFILLTVATIAIKTFGDKGIKDVSLNLVANQVTISSSAYNDLSPIETQKNIPVLPIIFSGLSILLLVFFWITAGRKYMASVATATAINVLSSNTIVGYNKLIEAYTLDPDNSLYRINFSQTSLNLANALAAKKDISDEDKKQITQLVEQSIREAKNATQLDPLSAITWENLANTYRQLINFAKGSADWSVATYGQTINIDPTNPSLRLQLGGVFYSLNDYDSAIKLFDQAVGLKSDWANAHYNLAMAYKAKKEYANALQSMQVVAQLLEPGSSDLSKVQTEISDLQKLVPATPTTQTDTGTSQLTTPTPIPTNTKTKVELPKTAAPNLPATTSAVTK